MLELLLGAVCVICILSFGLFLTSVSAYIILDIIEEWRRIKGGKK